MDEFKEIAIKLANGKKLSEDELKLLVYEAGEFEDDVRCVSTEYGDDNRWTRDVCTIVKLFDRHYRIDWEEGLTESCEDQFWDQPVEVAPKTEVIPAHEVTRWVEVVKCQ